MGQPDPTRPYNALPPLPPQAELETKAVLKGCISATSAVAELRLAGHLVPDQSVLINTIPLLEAKASSEIENIVTTNDALFRLASNAEDNGDPAAKEALRYRTALYGGLSTLADRPLTTRSAIEVCHAIKGVDMDVRVTPGTKIQNTFTGEIIYTPPAGEERLRELLANWEAYINEESDVEPLVKMAVQHYQFEAIHPFTDGNGRTGRIINLLYLIQSGLLEIPTLYLSRHILRTKVDYYRLLQGVTLRGEWEQWIVYMLEAVETTANWTNARIKAIRALMDHTTDVIKYHAPKLYSRELIDVIFAQPYTRISHLVDANIAKAETASKYLKQLAEIGILEEEKVGRDKLFIHRKYMNLLEQDGHDFAPYLLAEAKPAKPARNGRRRKK